MREASEGERNEESEEGHFGEVVGAGHGLEAPPGGDFEGVNDGDPVDNAGGGEEAGADVAGGAGEIGTVAFEDFG